MTNIQNTIKIILLILIIISIQDFAFGQVEHEKVAATEAEFATNATAPVEHANVIADILDAIFYPVSKKNIDAGPVIPEINFIEKFVKNLEEGKLIYNPPENMTVNVTEYINATIGKEKSSGEPIEISPCMEVYLNGSAFHVVPTTANRQFIASDRPTTWKWDVTPKKTGNHKLDLSAYVIITMPDGGEERRALVKSKTIQVQVNPAEKKEPPNVILSLFDGPWAKIIGGLAAVLAFLITFFKEDILAWYRSRKKPPS